jgi:hypothetical protein
LLARQYLIASHEYGGVFVAGDSFINRKYLQIPVLMVAAD